MSTRCATLDDAGAGALATSAAVASDNGSRTGPRVRIIAITGWGKEDDRKRSAEAGVDVHLVKPVDELELRRVMESQAESPDAPGTHSLH